MSKKEKRYNNAGTIIDSDENEILITGEQNVSQDDVVKSLKRVEKALKKVKGE